MISWIYFSKPSKSTSLMACSSSWNAIYAKQLFLGAGCYSLWSDFSHRLCASLIANFRWLFWPAVLTMVLLGFDADYSLCKHVLWVHPLSMGKTNRKECPQEISCWYVLVKGWHFNVTFWNKNKYMWCIARFGTICTILKTWKTPMEEC